MIQQKVDRGVYRKDIAAELGVHPRTVRFETAPGRQLQHDWAEIETLIASERRKAPFAVNSFGYSRRSHFWAGERVDAEHTYKSLVRSFAYLCGVLAEVLVDNQKVAVIKLRVGRAVGFNARFLDLAGHHGFRPLACPSNRQPEPCY